MYEKPANPETQYRLEKEQLPQLSTYKTGVWLIALILMLSLLGGGCTNYSSDNEIVNPPIILGITTEGTGHLVTVAAQNLEIGFLGYYLYEGLTEDAVRSTSTDSGINCGPFNIQPDEPLEYIIEVKPGQTAVTAGTSDNRLCAVSASLTSGRYIIFRSIIFSLSSISTSDPSNAMLVP